MREAISNTAPSKVTNEWPELNLNEWEGAYDTIHLWMQIVGKIKLEFTPLTNHWWNTTFVLSATGLTTGIIPGKYNCFEIEFDFVSHQLIVKSDDGRREFIEFRDGKVADFYFELKEILASLGIEIHIWTVPVEMDDRLPFDKDYRFRKYDPAYANKFWKTLVQVGKVMNVFRSGFTGKSSPVHFFWGAMDMAVTFFSGKPAPEHPGVPNVGKKVMAESYNSELASFGFWGGQGLGEAAFYAYTYPEPEKYSKASIEPDGAYYNSNLREFILPYSIVRKSLLPEKAVLEFFHSTYKAARELANWDKQLYKENLEVAL